MKMRVRVSNGLIYSPILKIEKETCVEMCLYALKLEDVGFVLSDSCFTWK